MNIFSGDVEEWEGGVQYGTSIPVKGSGFDVNRYDTLSANRTLIRTLRGKQLEATWYTWNTLVSTPSFNASFIYFF